MNFDQSGAFELANMPQLTMNNFLTIFSQTVFKMLSYIWIRTLLWLCRLWQDCEYIKGTVKLFSSRVMIDQCCYFRKLNEKYLSAQNKVCTTLTSSSWSMLQLGWRWVIGDKKMLPFLFFMHSYTESFQVWWIILLTIYSSAHPDHWTIWCRLFWKLISSFISFVILPFSWCLPMPSLL